MNAIRILMRHVRVFMKTWKHSLMYNVAEPLLYLSAMGFGLGMFVQEVDGVSYIEFIAPGMVALSGMYSATFECTYSTFVRIHYDKVFQGMLAAPVTFKDVVVGEILYGTVKSILFGLVILCVISLLGLVKSPAAILMPVVLALTGLVFAEMAFCYTAFIESIDHLNYYITLVITPFFLFGGLYFPAYALPHWVQIVNWANPLYHSVELCRAICWGQLNAGLGVHAGVLAAMAATLSPFPVKLMERKIIS
ncbi:MAG: yadH 4 [Firmicutes bacterium]|nr:yadH 4 [Bacillota bacterium]